MQAIKTRTDWPKPDVPISEPQLVLGCRYREYKNCPQPGHRWRRVRDDETLATIADEYGLRWKDIAEINWRTTKLEEVNWYLWEFVGCHVKSGDGRSLTFRDANPGRILVPDRQPSAGCVNLGVVRQPRDSHATKDSALKVRVVEREPRGGHRPVYGTWLYVFSGPGRDFRYDPSYTYGMFKAGPGHRPEPPAPTDPTPQPHPTPTPSVEPPTPRQLEGDLGLEFEGVFPVIKKPDRLEHEVYISNRQRVSREWLQVVLGRPDDASDQDARGLYRDVDALPDDNDNKRYRDTDAGGLWHFLDDHDALDGATRQPRVGRDGHRHRRGLVNVVELSLAPNGRQRHFYFLLSPVQLGPEALKFAMDNPQGLTPLLRRDASVRCQARKYWEDVTCNARVPRVAPAGPGQSGPRGETERRPMHLCRVHEARWGSEHPSTERQTTAQSEEVGTEPRAPGIPLPEQLVGPGPKDKLDQPVTLAVIDPYAWAEHLRQHTLPLMFEEYGQWMRGEQPALLERLKEETGWSLDHYQVARILLTLPKHAGNIAGKLIKPAQPSLACKRGTHTEIPPAWGESFRAWDEVLYRTNEIFAALERTAFELISYLESPGHKTIDIALLEDIDASSVPGDAFDLARGLKHWQMCLEILLSIEPGLFYLQDLFAGKRPYPRFVWSKHSKIFNRLGQDDVLPPIDSGLANAYRVAFDAMLDLVALRDLSLIDPKRKKDWLDEGFVRRRRDALISLINKHRLLSVEIAAPDEQEVLDALQTGTRPDHGAVKRHALNAAVRGLSSAGLVGTQPVQDWVAARPTATETNHVEPGVEVRTGHSHDRPTFEEQEVGFQRYSSEDGWIYVDGPGGDAGHPLTGRGLDGIAYHAEDNLLEINEHKSKMREVSLSMRDDPTAITTNLEDNLVKLIEKVRAMDDLPHQAEYLPHKARILTLLEQTLEAIRGNGPAPRNVTIVVTSGRATHITPGLRDYWTSRGVDLQIRFENISVLPELSPDEVRQLQARAERRAPNKLNDLEQSGRPLHEARIEESIDPSKAAHANGRPTPRMRALEKAGYGFDAISLALSIYTVRQLANRAKWHYLDQPSLWEHADAYVNVGADVTSILNSALPWLQRRFGLKLPIGTPGVLAATHWALISAVGVGVAIHMGKSALKSWRDGNYAAASFYAVGFVGGVGMAAAGAVAFGATLMGVSGANFWNPVGWILGICAGLVLLAAFGAWLFAHSDFEKFALHCFLGEEGQKTFIWRMPTPREVRGALGGPRQITGGAVLEAWSHPGAGGEWPIENQRRALYDLLSRFRFEAVGFRPTLPYKGVPYEGVVDLQVEPAMIQPDSTLEVALQIGPSGKKTSAKFRLPPRGPGANTARFWPFSATPKGVFDPSTSVLCATYANGRLTVSPLLNKVKYNGRDKLILTITLRHPATGNVIRAIQSLLAYSGGKVNEVKFAPEWEFEERSALGRTSDGAQRPTNRPSELRDTIEVWGGPSPSSPERNRPKP